MLHTYILHQVPFNVCNGEEIDIDALMSVCFDELMEASFRPRRPGRPKGSKNKGKDKGVDCVHKDTGKGKDKPKGKGKTVNGP